MAADAVRGTRRSSRDAKRPTVEGLAFPRATWEWFGHPGHLIVGEDCRFHLCTLVGPWLVSTVGEYLPDEPVRQIHCDVHGIKLEGRGDTRRADYMEKVGYQDIGLGRKYETMVFRVEGQRCARPDCGCGLPTPSSWHELDFDGYNGAGEATRGHMAICERWAARREIPPEDADPSPVGQAPPVADRP